MAPFFSNILCVGLGGAVGAILRYCVSLLFGGTHFCLSLPTVTVNITGSFLIGLLSALFAAYSAPGALRLLLIVGLLGGFTTFSTFAFDSTSLILKGEWQLFILNILINNVGSILAAIAGLLLGKFLFQ
ncbi:MAG: fluoride efflux transporter CrcB [Muribaculaceae bacterium]|nr:fluoride efflux transporter CrcB [Muribaculaceae bacterium]